VSSLSFGTLLSTMIYNGKKASLQIQEKLKTRITSLTKQPSLAVFSIAEHPSITSFIKIKRTFGEAIGVKIDEYSYEASFGEEALIKKIDDASLGETYTGIIVQLPLPATYNTQRVLDTIPVHLDVDILGTRAWKLFSDTNTSIPPVAGAVAHILQDTNTEIYTKNIVVIGNGILVGKPVSTWFKNKHANVTVVDITTPEDVRSHLYKEADIVVSGIGSPHHLKKEFFKVGVVLIDAGTSEQAGVLAGDCDPSCAEIASVCTPVPGGVGPLTVACLFENLVSKAELGDKRTQTNR
jgi:methylenetetrahydrofolate dehydrogenase (NADP+) / methenyltetrahydrofolate cyclohydrolase